MGDIENAAARAYPLSIEVTGRVPAGAAVLICGAQEFGPLPAGSPVTLRRGPCVVKVLSAAGAPLHSSDQNVMPDGTWQSTGADTLTIKI